LLSLLLALLSQHLLEECRIGVLSRRWGNDRHWLRLFDSSGLRLGLWRLNSLRLRTHENVGKVGTGKIGRHDNHPRGLRPRLESLCRRHKLHRLRRHNGGGVQRGKLLFISRIGESLRVLGSGILLWNRAVHAQGVTGSLLLLGTLRLIGAVMAQRISLPSLRILDTARIELVGISLVQMAIGTEESGEALFTMVLSLHRRPIAVARSAWSMFETEARMAGLPWNDFATTLLLLAFRTLFKTWSAQ